VVRRLQLRLVLDGERRDLCVGREIPCAAQPLEEAEGDLQVP
jgi:hypothetical protein